MKAGEGEVCVLIRCLLGLFFFFYIYKNMYCASGFYILPLLLFIKKKSDIYGELLIIHLSGHGTLQ